MGVELETLYKSGWDIEGNAGGGYEKTAERGKPFGWCGRFGWSRRVKSDGGWLIVGVKRG